MMLESETIIFYGDKDFNQKERKQLLKACQEWYEFTKGKIDIKIIFEYNKLDLDIPMEDHIIIKVDSSFYYIKNYDLANKTTVIGFCIREKDKPINILLVANRLIAMDDFQLTAKHEFGHALGLFHIEDAGVMHPSSSTFDFIEADAIEFCRANGCELEDLNYK